MRQLEHDVIIWAEVHLPISFENYNRAIRNEDIERIKRLTKSIRKKFKEAMK